jgi:hypothetical protein
MSKHLVFMIIIFWREEETLRTRTSYEVLVHFICELFLFIARMELTPDYLERRSSALDQFDSSALCGVSFRFHPLAGVIQVKV